MTNVQYITDAQGHKTSVILPIEDYEEMLEDCISEQQPVRVKTSLSVRSMKLSRNFVRTES